MSEHTSPLYHGTREALAPRDEIPPREGFVYCTPNLDGAIWAAELATGDAAPRVYEVAANGSTENA